MSEATELAAGTHSPPSHTAVDPQLRTKSLLREGFSHIWKRPTFLMSGAIILVVLLMAAVPRLFTGRAPTDCQLSDSRGTPRSGHPMGFDLQGCDYYTTIVHGARTSMTIGMTVAALTFVIALVAGSLAGYYGGWVDAVISRTADIMLGVPVMIASLVILYQFKDRTIWTMILVLVLFSWAGTMRYLRGSVLQVKQLEYIQAAKVLGVSGPTILRRHVIPNAITPLIVMSTLSIGASMTAEAAFSILGVGLKLPSYSWGLSIAQASADGNWQVAPLLMLVPAAMLALTTLAFVVLGENCVTRSTRGADDDDAPAGRQQPVRRAHDGPWPVPGHRGPVLQHRGGRDARRAR